MDFKALGAAIMAAIQHAADGELEQAHLDAIDKHLAADDVAFATKDELSALASRIDGLSGAAPVDTSGFASKQDVTDLAGRVSVIEGDLSDLAGGASGAPTPPTPPPPPIHITVSPAALSDGQVGAAYSASLSADGGRAPYTYAVIDGALPGGLILGGDGTITGTPTVEGSSGFTVAAHDADGVIAQAAYNINVLAAAPAETDPAAQGG